MIIFLILRNAPLHWNLNYIIFQMLYYLNSVLFIEYFIILVMYNIL